VTASSRPLDAWLPHHVQTLRLVLWIVNKSACPLGDPFLVFLVLAGLHSLIFLVAAIRYLFYGINWGDVHDPVGVSDPHGLPNPHFLAVGAGAVGADFFVLRALTDAGSRACVTSVVTLSGDVSVAPKRPNIAATVLLPEQIPPVSPATVIRLICCSLGMSLSPVRPDPKLYLQGDLERSRPLHLFDGYSLGDFQFRFRDLEQQLIVDLKNHPGPQPF